LTIAIRELCCRFDIFIVDDLDKTKITESFDSNLFAFIDEPYKNQKTIYISSNKSLKDLVEISGFNGATVRKIQNMTDVVRF
jgi:DNA replication protein DnaC